jgi:hypothetical protein
VETIQAGNGQTLLSTQVDQLIQAMAGFTATTGLTWDAASGGAGDPGQQAQFQGIIAATGSREMRSLCVSGIRGITEALLSRAINGVVRLPVWTPLR